MNFVLVTRWVVVACILMLTGCVADERKRCAQKVSLLDSLEREAHANVFRANAECRAQEIEFGNASTMATSCQQSLQISRAAQQSTMANVAKRRSEPDYQNCVRLAAEAQPRN